MEKWQDFVWQLLIGLVVIFIGGWILGGILNFIALASPQMVSAIFCPAGSTATTGSGLGQPGQAGSKLSCYDQNGKSVPPLSDEYSVVLQRKYFYKPSTVIMIILVLGWFVWQRKKINRESAKTAYPDR